MILDSVVVPWLMGLGIVTAMTIIIWACGLHWQLTFTREDPGTKINYKDAAYRGKAPLFFFCTVILPDVFIGNSFAF